MALLRRCGCCNDRALVEQILTDLKTAALRQPAAVEAALGFTVVALLGILAAMHATVEQLETALAIEFEQHPLASVLCSAPGLRPVLAARALADVGDDDNRFTTVGGLRAFAGTAPVTRASGPLGGSIRRVRNERLGDTCRWWAFAAFSKSPGARAHYDRRAGDHHNAALRNLANKVIGRMWWCLHNNRTWDEDAALNPADIMTNQVDACIRPAWDVYVATWSEFADCRRRVRDRPPPRAIVCWSAATAKDVAFVESCLSMALLGHPRYDRRAEHPTTEGPGAGRPRWRLQRATILTRTSWCCDDRLNSPIVPPGSGQSAWQEPVRRRAAARTGLCRCVNRSRRA